MLVPGEVLVLTFGAESAVGCKLSCTLYESTNQILFSTPFSPLNKAHKSQDFLVFFIVSQGFCSTLQHN